MYNIELKLHALAYTDIYYIIFFFSLEHTNTTVAVPLQQVSWNQALIYYIRDCIDALNGNAMCDTNKDIVAKIEALNENYHDLNSDEKVMLGDEMASYGFTGKFIQNAMMAFLDCSLLFNS